MKFLIFLLLVVNYSCSNSIKDIQKNRDPDNTKTKVLLVGTSHFKTFDPSKNFDISQVQQIDVLTEQSQRELSEITSNIIEFKPDKIFVERVNQHSLDSTYQSFNPSDYSKVIRDELQQIAFRCAKALHHQKVYAMNYKNTQFPYYDMIESMKTAEQKNLLENMENWKKAYETKYNSIVRETGSVKEILFYLNSPEYQAHDISFYFISNKAGDLEQDVGSYLTAEWFKRNIYMLSKIQKQTIKGEKIMILAGASHVTVWRDMIKYIPEWEIIELKQIIN